nr:13592_t:CDS:10 [Entrophospora candida]
MSYPQHSVINNNDDDDYNTTINDKEYQIIRKFNYGRNLNVFRVYKKPIETEYYIIKRYDNIVSYKREVDALVLLSEAKNIMQIVDRDPSRMVVVSECALYDLETFFKHQTWTQRQAEKVPIIKDIVAALSECQNQNIVHLDLSPKNIMYFYDENWKLIGFDSVCTADKTQVSKTTTIKYHSPELIQAEKDGGHKKAQFSMDMFSFGLILYYIENGYWNITDQKWPDKKLLINTTEDPHTVYVIENLLEKNVNNRMTLVQFKESIYYEKLSKVNVQEQTYHEKCKVQIEKEAKKLNPDIKDDELKQMNFDLQQEQFLERYHQEMKISLKDMNKKLDEVKTSVLNLTETILRMLMKTQNEKTPRVFIIVPEHHEFKNPMSWYTNPFRMYFVCEHNDHWHVPKQEGYIIGKVPEFIKKYGPWIQLCIKALVFGSCIETSNLFPQEINNVLLGTFNIKIGNRNEVVQYFQEIIDTIGVGVKEINDTNPDLVPLEHDKESNCQILNASGIHALASFVKSKQKSGNFGGLVQCINKKNQNVIWLCDEHQNDNSYIHFPNRPAKPFFPNSSLPNSPAPSAPPTPTNSQILSAPSTPPNSQILSASQTPIQSLRRPTLPSDKYQDNFHQEVPCSSLPIPLARSNSKDSIIIMNIDSLVPLMKLVNDILLDVFSNASECIHFDTDETKKVTKVTQYMHENLENLKDLHQKWDSSDQKKLLQTILERYIIGYVYFLTVIYRYCYEWYITSTIFVDGRENENELNNISSNLAYNNDNKCEDKTLFNDILVIKNRRLKEKILVFGKELDSRCFNNEDNIDCIEKEIYMYSEQNLNGSDYILKFLGFTVDKFKPILHYEYANYGNLYNYLKNNENLPENEKLTLDAKLSLSLDVCFGLEFLHEKRILHLDLRSSNIYLFKSGFRGEFPKPKISNFLYSVYMSNKHTIVKPCLPNSINNQVRKRWHEPQRLHNEKHCCTVESDYYSLGMLIWEIFNATGALPYEEIEIEHLYEHLKYKNACEIFPKNLLPQYSSLITRITKSWEYDISKQTTLATMISTLRGFHKKKRRTSSTKCIFRTVMNQQYLTKSEEAIQKYSEIVESYN